MLRSAVMAGVIVLSCAGVALPAKAQSRGPIDSRMPVAHAFQRPALQARREALIEHGPAFDRHQHLHRHHFFVFGVPYYYLNDMTYAELPPVSTDEGAAVPLPSPAPPQVTDLPPCREESGGVTIFRSTRCRH